jgi:hypothetical protein
LNQPRFREERRGEERRGEERITGRRGGEEVRVKRRF